MTREETVATGSPFKAIEDYAIVGDCRTAALIARDGSIDWLCWPRFDSPSIFAAILDPDSGGHFSLTPSSSYEGARTYRPRSNVLVSTFRAASGTLQLTDLLFAAPDAQVGETWLLPDSMLIRQLRAVSGEVEVKVRFEPRLNYGSAGVNFIRAGRHSLAFRANGGLVHLATDFDLELVAGEAVITLREGQLANFVLSFNESGTAIFPPMAHVDQLIDSTDAYWHSWAQRIQYNGPHPEVVARSALVLKLLTYSPSGAIIAAPTTSLPEKIGATYNWDYRYCWLRDASQTVNAFFGLGLFDEAQAFLHWLLHATRLTHPRLQVVYDVFGRTNLKERELDHLRGYRGSGPVRVGNSAYRQNQLDIYGEVLNAAVICRGEGIALSRDEEAFLEGIAKYVLKHWMDADDGIWETREGSQYHVHSKVLAWVALDRASRLAQDGVLSLDPMSLGKAASEVRQQIEKHGFNQVLQSYTARFDSENLDASVLTMPILGFEDSDSSRIKKTIARIRSDLAQDDLVFRHDSEETEGEGAFLLCSFWLVECLALQGKTKEAGDLFERLVYRANDVGLFSEEIDPASGEFLGNFPQAFTHLGLVNAALALEHAHARQELKQ
jgi:GH15 family glucan-1,4-alpha-glucosidase